MFPVFSLVWDKDVIPQIALTYPELYKELAKGRSLSFKTFFLWILISIYQGGAIMYGSLILFEQDMNHIVAISFTSLILTELLMVGLTIRTWHYINIISMLFSLVCYILSLIILKEFFGKFFLLLEMFLILKLLFASRSAIHTNFTIWLESFSNNAHIMPTIVCFEMYSH